MNTLADRLNLEADLCANEGANDIAALLWEAAAAIAMSPPGVGTWPIAKLVVDEAGAVTASFYTPGLPAGSYDVWLPGSNQAPSASDETKPSEREAQFLFVAMDDDKRASVTYCADRDAVQQAVKAAMFWLPDGEELDADNLNMLAGVVETLLEDGAMNFEGDPPLYLYRLAAAPAPAAQPLTQAATDVLAERQRQVSVEGWTPEHDDEYRRGQLRQAAACYALFNTLPTPTMWPWSPGWWKPSENHRRNLVKAAALLLAEIERIDRAAGATHA